MLKYKDFAVTYFFSATWDACKEMATSTRPSAAQEALCTTDEKANFQRLTRLLTVSYTHLTLPTNREV